MSRTKGSISITTLPSKRAHKLKSSKAITPKNNPGPKWKGVSGIYLGRIVGNKITSLKEWESVNKATNLSIPNPKPAAGGMPYSKASI